MTENSTNFSNISPDYQTMFGYQGYQSFSYGQDQLYNTDINQAGHLIFGIMSNQKSLLTLNEFNILHNVKSQIVFSFMN